jgi:peptide deformylase
VPNIYKTLQYPDKLLTRPGREVVSLDDKTKEIIAKLFVTLEHQTNCAALAATQLGVDLRITVINHAIVKDGLLECTTLAGDESDFVSVKKEQALCLINPKIIYRSEEMVNIHEGCMSVGGKIHEKVKRHKLVKCEFMAESGQVLVIKADSFLSRCIQHELDHLDGMLFIDRLSPLKRKLVDVKFTKRTKKKA